MTVTVGEIEMFGRRVITTSLDQVPAIWRAPPGWVVLTDGEIAAMRAEMERPRGDDTPVLRRVLAMIQMDDDLHAARLVARSRRGRPRRRRSLVVDVKKTAGAF